MIVRVWHAVIIRRVAVLFMAGSSVACSSGPEALLEDYAARMARGLDQAVAQPVPTRLPTFPRNREQAISQPEVRLGLRDAWSLRDCLGQLIGLRNSSLGKVMPPSQRLAYETQFAAALHACTETLESDAVQDEQVREQRAALLDIAQAKQGAVQAAAQAFVLRDQELARFWRTPARHMSHAPPPVRSDALSGLADLLDLALAGQPIEGSQLEQAVEQLQGSLSLGSIAQTEVLAAAHLNAITAAIHARLDRRPLCFQQQATPAARVLQTVFSKVYAGQVQPWLAQVRSAARAARAPARRLMTSPELDKSEVMKVYHAAVLADGKGSAQAVFLTATRAHSKAWQRLLGQCGMMPQRPG